MLALSPPAARHATAYRSHCFRTLPVGARPPARKLELQQARRAKAREVQKSLGLTPAPRGRPPGPREAVKTWDAQLGQYLRTPLSSAPLASHETTIGGAAQTLPSGESTTLAATPLVASTHPTADVHFTPTPLFFLLRSRVASRTALSRVASAVYTRPIRHARIGCTQLS